MALFNNDLNKIAIAMGKNIKLLDELSKNVRNTGNIGIYKEDFLVLAYTCRVGILDRIEDSGYSLSTNIVVPLGVFRSKKTNIHNGISLTIGKLQLLASQDLEVSSLVTDILEKKEAFYEFESILPQNIKSQI